MRNAIVKITFLLATATNSTNLIAEENVNGNPYMHAKSTIESSDKIKTSLYPLSSVDMQLVQVAAHTYYVQGMPGTATDNQGFVSNAGVIITDQGVVVFDALGTPSLAQLLLQKIRDITDKPVIKVVTSHYHADHFYGLQVFKDLGAEIIAAKGVEKYLQSDAANGRLNERKKSLNPWVSNTTRIVNPDTIISNQTELQIGDVTLRLTPMGKNHSDSDLIMHVSPDNVLFVGDLVFEQRVPFLVTGDSRQWLETLTNMNFENVEVIIPGHGSASTHPANALNATKSYLGFMRDTMQKAVQELIPFDEAYNVDWRQYENLPAFKKSNRINAYSVYLSIESESLNGN